MIAVFSGTGNSLMVARRLADIIGEPPLLYPATATVADSEPVVWVFPVYSWGVPPVVVRWMHDMARGLRNSGEHYAVMTCGDDAGNAARQWRHLIDGIGCRPARAFTVIMPNTYVLMKGFDTDPLDVEQAKLAAAPARIDLIGQLIAARTPGADMVERGRWARLKSSVIYPWFVRHAMSPRPFHPTEACVGCGLCSRACPLDNIAMNDRRPAWGSRCALCLRCYHICPHHAVAYGRSTRGKGRYTAMLHLIGLRPATRQ